MTDVGLIMSGGRSLDFAPVLEIARTGATLGMTGGVEMKKRLHRLSDEQHRKVSCGEIGLWISGEQEISKIASSKQFMGALFSKQSFVLCRK